MPSDVSVAPDGTAPADVAADVTARPDVVAPADASTDTAATPDAAPADVPVWDRPPMHTVDPACIPLRPEIGRGVGPGPDRCETFAAPVNGSGPTWCSLGADVPGLRAPEGFCIRRYASIGLPRVMALAPNGDLFVSSPSVSTAAGDSGGLGAIVVLSDDNRDGVAEVTNFASGAGLETVHGLAFHDGFLWFTTIDAVYRTPYAMGQRSETRGARQLVVGGGGSALGNLYQRGGRWTHGLARSVNGRLLTTRGEYSVCSATPDGRPAPGQGAIYELGMGALNMVGSGFRNPMYARCHPCRDVCLIAELGNDQTPDAWETLHVIENDHWGGFPCCYTNTAGPNAATGLCRCIDEQRVKITLGDTPFGFDWERGAWPEPWRNGFFIALHGSFYLPDYQGAGVAFLPVDPATGAPRQATPVRFLEATNGSAQPSLLRPSDVVFSTDGRMFVSDDKGRGVYWLAPTTWRR